jgi:hypothetical protein
MRDGEAGENVTPGVTLTHAGASQRRPLRGNHEPPLFAEEPNGLRVEREPLGSGPPAETVPGFDRGHDLVVEPISPITASGGHWPMLSPRSVAQ